MHALWHHAVVVPLTTLRRKNISIFRVELLDTGDGTPNRKLIMKGGKKNKKTKKKSSSRPSHWTKAVWLFQIRALNSFHVQNYYTSHLLADLLLRHIGLQCQLICLRSAIGYICRPHLRYIIRDHRRIISARLNTCRETAQWIQCTFGSAFFSVV